jgi:gentisate 1,2-dioxygenase
MTSTSELREPFAPALERANIQPLWDRYDRLLPAEPTPPDRPMQWRWQSLLPLIERAANDVSMERSERRVLMLVNPAFGGKPFTTTNLFAGIQILEPGERARLHRHTPSAMRFILEGQGGAATVVDGQVCDMLPGDLILTPSWCWHEHMNDSGKRCVWLDALDMPLATNLGVLFAEHGKPQDNRHHLWQLDDGAFATAGLLPDTTAERGAFSPMFRYPWSRTVTALEQAPFLDDGSRRVRYVDPTTGGPAIASLDCYAWQLPGRGATPPARSTANAVFAVVEGEGVSEIGGETVQWSQHDVFTVPHWTWASHKAQSAGARLFYFTDREVLRRLNWLREETRR